MIVAGLILAVIVLIFSIILTAKSKNFDLLGIFIAIAIAAIVTIVILVVIGINDLNIIGTKPGIIQEQIQILEEENSKIESEITRMVYDYQEYEKQTFDMLLADTDNAIAVANVIPSLSSNELVVREMRIYNENRKQIANLKMQLVDIERVKWEVYFGN